MSQDVSPRANFTHIGEQGGCFDQSPFLPLLDDTWRNLRILWIWLVSHVQPVVCPSRDRTLHLLTLQPRMILNLERIPRLQQSLSSEKRTMNYQG
ncbi:Hypothetical protein NTJ_14359 [Nesidiocoris tenuis]|uniref:Uncharacterized protein n=1 Tax=Nesidiocoris tenuis TaxID=355587 RepID=A0ABN7BAX8_9HEMI|nr:Hypothetical protein NTJ_14359 [Nesidiocoris tenuis]